MKLKIMMMSNYALLRQSLLTTGILLLFLNQGWSTHNRAGEISVKQVGDCTQSLTVQATVITYTKASSRPADRDTLTICWGDGICERIARTNGGGNPPQGEVLENDTKFNIYIGFHTYASRGTYAISMTDPNRNGGILNVNYPNSEQIKFHIQTTYTIPNPQFQGCNNTPVLLQPPIDIGCVGQVFTHNPNAYDEDKDSLSYHFIVPREDVNRQVPNYLFPNEINPGSNNQLTIDPVKGDIVWATPQKAGEYNLAMVIIEYRAGIAIDTIIRDMQILIEDCDNQPPTVTTSEEEICVIAGQTVEIEVVAGAPEFEMNQQVRLTALGGPFEVAVNPATFEPNNNGFLDDPLRKVFRWETTCEHISNQWYSVVFKATDNFFGDTSGLATLKTVRIKVIGPAPENVEAAASSGQVSIYWDLPYVCEDAEDNYFRGFTVWRREGGIAPPIDTCFPALNGYIRLNNIPTRATQDGRYFYLDTNVEAGRTYCYRVTAQFALTTPGGNYTYNPVQSLPSPESCLQLNRDLPLITHVDVRATDAANGQIRLCWSKPRAGDLDTILNPGPYTYEVLRATGFTENPADFQPIGVSFTSPTFAGANDTCFTDAGLNTLASPYTYRINFLVDGNRLLGTTNPASSVFLTVNPTDNANQLSWEENVPWENQKYVVYRQNAQGTFDSIATVSTPSYRDAGLLNGREYCYQIKSIGAYLIDNVISPLINFSQEACGVPFDNIAPCAPTLTVEDICGKPVDCSDPNQLVNTLRWVNPEEICPETDDVVSYNIYYAPTVSEPLELIASVDDARVTVYEHRPGLSIAGCYAVTALDTFRNESPFSDTVCVENCPIYQLPNAFTPNGDGQNEVFKPYPFCFVASVEFQVFNRWGQLVFETTDPNLNWDGTNLRGEALASATYFYTCRVFESTVEGVLPAPELLRGYIELLRGE